MIYRRTQEREESYGISSLAGEQGSQSPMKNQAGIEKFVIRMKTDVNGNDQGTENGGAGKDIFWLENGGKEIQKI